MQFYIYMRRKKQFRIMRPVVFTFFVLLGILLIVFTYKAATITTEQRSKATSSQYAYKRWNFDTGTDGWAARGGTLGVSNGTLVFTPRASQEGNALMYQGSYSLPDTVRNRALIVRIRAVPITTSTVQGVSTHTESSVIPGAPSWFNLLPVNLRNFLEQLYMFVFVFQRTSDMGHILEGIVGRDTGDDNCIQRIAYAHDPQSGECRQFSTPCDIPPGWEEVTGCGEYRPTVTPIPTCSPLPPGCAKISFGTYTSTGSQDCTPPAGGWCSPTTTPTPISSQDKQSTPTFTPTITKDNRDTRTPTPQEILECVVMPEECRTRSDSNIHDLRCQLPPGGWCSPTPTQAKDRTTQNVQMKLLIDNTVVSTSPSVTVPLTGTFSEYTFALPDRALTQYGFIFVPYGTEYNNAQTTGYRMEIDWITLMGDDPTPPADTNERTYSKDELSQPTKVSSTVTPIPTIPSNWQANHDCVAAGCSGELCVPRGQAGDIASTCQYLAWYACLQYSRCELQADNQCGWTQTAQFLSCKAETEFGQTY